MEPITGDLSLRKQNMFLVEMESQNLYSCDTLFEKVVLIGWQTRKNLRQEHLQAQLLDSDFCHRTV